MKKKLWLFRLKIVHQKMKKQKKKNENFVYLWIKMMPMFDLDNNSKTLFHCDKKTAFIWCLSWKWEISSSMLRKLAGKRWFKHMLQRKFNGWLSSTCNNDDRNISANCCTWRWQLFKLVSDASIGDALPENVKS